MRRWTATYALNWGRRLRSTAAATCITAVQAPCALSNPYRELSEGAGYLCRVGIGLSGSQTEGRFPRAGECSQPLNRGEVLEISKSLGHRGWGEETVYAFDREAVPQFIQRVTGEEQSVSCG